MLHARSGCGSSMFFKFCRFLRHWFLGFIFWCTKVENVSSLWRGLSLTGRVVNLLMFEKKAKEIELPLGVRGHPSIRQTRIHTDTQRGTELWVPRGPGARECPWRSGAGAR